MSTKTASRPSPRAKTQGGGAPADRSWDGIRAQLEEMRYRLNREIGSYPTPIPACDQDYNHMLAERERVNEELARLDEAQKRSAGAADPRAAVDEFVRSSPYLKNW